MKKILVLLLSLCAQILTAQNPACGTPDITPAQEQANQILLQQIKQQNANKKSPLNTTWIPIKPHIFRYDDGSGGVGLRELNNGLAQLNQQFLPMEVQFYFCGTAPDYINNSNFNTNNYNSTDENNIQVSNGVNNAHNVYFVEDPHGYGGYSYGATQFSLYNRTYMRNFQTEDFKTWPHEMGHYFSLAHTFNGQGQAGQAQELVTRNFNETSPRLSANCNASGDYLCDTPADPRGRPNNSVDYYCMYQGSATDDNGDLFAPDVDNIMDYNFCKPYRFTPQQYLRMADGLQIVTTPYGNPVYDYTLDCPETSQLPPTNTIATNLNNNFNSGILLTWTDNSTTETGYLIERATNPNGPFTTLIGVAPNTNTYTDQKTTSNTTYYYRIKASNTKSNFSTTSPAVTTPAYCLPRSYNPCTGGPYVEVRIDGFVFNNASNPTIRLIDNSNSACSPNGFGDYYNSFSANISRGQQYNFTVFADNRAGSYYPLNVGIFVDYNQDGDFEDAGEQVFLDPTPNGNATQIDGSFTIPASALSGNTRMRVRAQFQSYITTSACETFNFGETEDYKLIISSPTPIELLSFTAKLQKSTTSNQVQTNWTTATEKNTSHFNLQRSPNGKDWQKIAQIKAAGQSTQQLNYQYLDLSPLAGTSYYRLEAQDFDTKTQYSNIQSVSNTQETNTFFIYPNPNQGNNININTTAQNIESIKLYAIDGKEIPMTTNTQTPNEIQIIPQIKLPAGVYIITQQAQGTITSQKLIIN
jgi:hypothetical protein